MHFSAAVIDLENPETARNNPGLSQGTQLDGVTLFLSGEIYNYRALQKKYNLPPGDEAETLLRLYQMLGVDMVEEISGVFAWVLFDPLLQSAKMATDRAGVKPLYYSLAGSQLAFATSLNDLKTVLPLEIDPLPIYRFLRFGHFAQGSTPYRNVFQLEAGTMALTINRQIARAKWWDVHDRYHMKSRDGLAKATEKTNAILGQAVDEVFTYAGPSTAVLLSGGIDSGIVTALAAQRTSKLKTFTIRFSGGFDETRHARLTAEKYDTEHTEILIETDQLAKETEQLLLNYGTPFFDSSAIPTYYACREASRYAPAILNGDGADELFGGYRRYVPFAAYNFFGQNGLSRRFFRLMHSALPPGQNKMSLYNYLHRLTALAAKEGLEQYLSATADIFEDFEHALVVPGDDYLQEARQHFQKIVRSPMSPLKKIMNLDFDFVLFSDHLPKMEVAATSNGILAFSPFMSNDMLHYAPTLADHLKIRNRTTKFLLRNLAKKYLPAALINQPKRGFEIPLKKWLENDLRELLFDYLAPVDAYSHNYLEKGFIHKLLQNQIPVSGEKRAKMLWTLLTLEIWKYHEKTYAHVEDCGR